jgi:HSP20 family protein
MVMEGAGGMNDDKRSYSTGLLTFAATVLVAMVGFQTWKVRQLERRIGEAMNQTDTRTATGGGHWLKWPKHPGNDGEGSAAKDAAPKPHDDSRTDDDPWSLFDRNLNDWDPFKEMQSLQERIDRMFGGAFDRFGHSPKFRGLFDSPLTFSPSADIKDEGDHYRVSVDLPGVEKSNITIDLKGQTLTLSGTIDESKSSDEQGTTIRKERRSGQFQRVITLPGPVQADKVDATQENGILQIVIPKDVQDKAGSRIPVK